MVFQASVESTAICKMVRHNNSREILIQAEKSFTPIAAAERLQSVDVLRGFALFGILLVNMPMFAWPMRVIITQVAEWKGLSDNLAYSFIALFGESKFFSMFSLLFGFGLYMMMERTEARGGRFVPIYLRRLLVLLLIGLVHVLVFWAGDILVPYAILGGLLLLFHKAQSKTLLTWGVTILCLVALFYVGLLGFVALRNMQPDSAVRMAQFFAETKAAYKQAAVQTIQVYRHGTLAEILTVVVYTLQIPFSLWWLARFRFGPTEWLWRSLTYLQWQPLRLKVP